jgi:hypothetical protein
MGPARYEQYFFIFIQKFQINSNLERSKWCLPFVKKFEINYGFEGFEIRNKFPYRNFLRFKVEIELKFREPKGVKFN